MRERIGGGSFYLFTIICCHKFVICYPSCLDTCVCFFLCSNVLFCLNLDESQTSVKDRIRSPSLLGLYRIFSLSLDSKPLSSSCYESIITLCHMVPLLSMCLFLELSRRLVMRPQEENCY